MTIDWNAIFNVAKDLNDNVCNEPVTLLHYPVDESPDTPIEEPETEPTPVQHVIRVGVEVISRAAKIEQQGEVIEADFRLFLLAKTLEDIGLDVSDEDVRAVIMRDRIIVRNAVCSITGIYLSGYRQDTQKYIWVDIYAKRIRR